MIVTLTGRNKQRRNVRVECYSKAHTHKNVTAVFFFQLLSTGTSTKIECKVYVRGMIFIYVNVICSM